MTTPTNTSPMHFDFLDQNFGSLAGKKLNPTVVVCLFDWLVGGFFLSFCCIFFFFFDS